MAGSFWRRWRGNASRGYRRNFRRYSSRKYRYGNQRSANAQRDNARVVINVQKTYQIPVDAGNTSNAIAINAWFVLLQSNMFAAYRGMYDQVKITGITAKIRGLNGSTALTMANTPTICTAWDRNGLEQTSTQAEPLLSYNTVSSYSSAVITNWSPGNAFRVTRHLYPSTLSEKSYYAACGAFDVNDRTRNPAASYSNENGVDFKPILLIGAYSGFQTEAQQSIGLMIEFDINVTFRGLRRYSVVPETAAEQISGMAGTYLNGAGAIPGTSTQGQNQVAALTGNWTYVNNDGTVQSEEIPVKPEATEP